MRTMPAPLAAAALTTALAAMPSAHAPGSQVPPPSFRSAVNLVALNVSVQDLKSHYVNGLRAEDFLVFEDGVRQEVRFFEAGQLPTDLLVLLDTSRSMAERLDVAQEAARGFLDTLREGDRGAVIAFNDTVKVLAPLTCDRGALDEAIDGTVAGGNTSLHTALYIALRQFGQRIGTTTGGVRRQAIAVLSDGEDTSSSIGFEDVMTVARQSGVAIYTLRLQASDLVHDADPQMRKLSSEADYEMKALARETGALSFFPSEPQQLDSMYDAIAADLASQYSIGYEPAREKVAESFHRIQVQILNRPELRARTRTGYTTTAMRATTHP